MTQSEYELLVRIEGGDSVLRPDDPGPGGRDAFQPTIELLLKLRARGWVRVPDSAIPRDPADKAMQAGPCDLTAAGRRALEDDRRMGPRS